MPGSRGMVFDRRPVLMSLWKNVALFAEDTCMPNICWVQEDPELYSG
jgi:hypothetical protein